jgi:5-methylcytosine-specific restriction enzyme A
MFIDRRTARQRGYTHEWEKARLAYIKGNPLYVECLKVKRVNPARAVDHIIPHKGDMEFFWEKANWQSLCIPCHNRKSSMEGAFNKRPASSP